MTQKYVMLQEAAPFSMRFDPALAKEIGVQESLVFNQLFHWIMRDDWLEARGSVKEYKGRRFLTIGQTEMHRIAIWYVDRTTLGRILKRLVRLKLIIQISSPDENSSTNWIAINLEEAQKLESVRIEPLAASNGACADCTPPLGDSHTPPVQDAHLSYIKNLRLQDSRSQDGEGETPELPATENTAQDAAPPSFGNLPEREKQAWVNDLALLCQLDPELQRGHLVKRASDLYNAGYAREHLCQIAQYWYKHDWRGLKRDIPRPEEAIQVAKKALAMRPLKTMIMSCPRCGTPVEIADYEADDPYYCVCGWSGREPDDTEAYMLLADVLQRLEETVINPYGGEYD